MVQSFRKIVLGFQLVKLKKLPYVLAVLLLGIFSRQIKAVFGEFIFACAF